MSTIVSYLGSNAFKFKDNVEPGEGMVYSTRTGVWEERDVAEKEGLMGYEAGETATPGVTCNLRAIRLGRAMEGTTTRWLGALLRASQT